MIKVYTSDNVTLKIEPNIMIKPFVTKIPLDNVVLVRHCAYYGNPDDDQGIIETSREWIRYTASTLVGKFAVEGIKKVCIVHSPTLRTTQTGEAMAEAFTSLGLTTEVRAGRMLQERYLLSDSLIQSIAMDYESDTLVILVTHQPVLEKYFGRSIRILYGDVFGKDFRIEGHL